MLIIKSEQIRMFEQAAQARFEARLTAHLAEKYGAEECGDTAALVHIAVERSEQYGITSKTGVATFAELMVEEGRDFDNDPDRPLARATLIDTQLPEAAKLAQLLHTRPWRTPGDSTLPIGEDR
jgi:hypothetical protein